jgi:hypothetical protein
LAPVSGDVAAGGNSNFTDTRKYTGTGRARRLYEADALLKGKMVDDATAPKHMKADPTLEP